MEWLWPSLAFACSITNINYRYPQKFTDFYDVIAAKSESPVDFFFTFIFNILSKSSILSNMDKIASFTVNHLDLLTGIYVSRKDHLESDTITTFDLRFTRPNVEPVMDTAAIHALEHLGATFLRNDPEWKDKTIYFGPMGCRTGFYLIMRDAVNYQQTIDLVKAAFAFAADFEGEIPGAKQIECGNYLEHDLPGAKAEAAAYVRVLENVTPDTLTYPA